MTNLEKTLHDRSQSLCETCGATNYLAAFPVAPYTDEDAHHNILLCDTCRSQIIDPAKTEPNHWRCLNESMWSEVPAVKVIAWRMLNRIKDEGWPQDLLDMLYLDDEQLKWARTGEEKTGSETAVQHLDSNGTLLSGGDSVVLIKDLDVKGANFTAKRGTQVRNIRLVENNPEQIEGRVEGQQIVILTKYVKKS